MEAPKLRLFGDSRGGGPSDGERSDRTLDDFRLKEEAGTVVKETGQGIDRRLELVANFTVERIRTGTARFLNCPGTPVHVVDVQNSSNGPFSVGIRGSVYHAPAYEQQSKGRLVVPRPALFQTYLSHKVDRRRIQHDDPSVDQTFLVGTFPGENGQLVPNDGVDFPRQRQECLYHLHRFAQSGDKSVFDKVAALQTGDAIRVILTWGLGALLKPALGWTYPHLQTTADSGVGKSTIAEILGERFGWICLAGPLEFGTVFRAKKAVANTVLPLQFQEMNRLSQAAVRRLTQVLNVSFDAEPTTHGPSGTTYVLTAPTMMWGQDSPVTDIALAAKLIRVDLAAEAKDPSALRALRKWQAVWPMQRWVHFLCDWANRRDVRALAATKTDDLRRRVQNSGFVETSTTDRTIANYATMLVTAEALNEFGVAVDIDAAIVGLLRQHLKEQTQERGSVARQVLSDFLLELQKPSGRGSLIYDLTPDGLYFKPRNVLLTLRRRGYAYGITSAGRLTRMLGAEKFGTPSVQHRVGGVQTRYFFVPRKKLAELGFEYDRGSPW